MTGPLAQQFADVRYAFCGCDNCERAAAALSVIERHVQDMTEALRPFAARTCVHTITASDDENANAEALAEKREACPYCRARAALSAREEGSADE